MIRAPHFGGLNHDPRAGLNGSSIRRHLRPGRRFWGKPDINRLTKPAEPVANDPNRPSVCYPKRTAAAFFGQHFSGAHKSPKLCGPDLMEHGPFRAPV